MVRNQRASNAKTFSFRIWSAADIFSPTTNRVVEITAATERGAIAKIKRSKSTHQIVAIVPCAQAPKSPGEERRRLAEQRKQRRAK